MEIYEIKNDHTFAILVPSEDDFDTDALTSFVSAVDEPFPIRSLTRLSKDDEPVERPIADMFLLYGLAIPIVREEAYAKLPAILTACAIGYPCESEEGRFVALKVAAVTGTLDLARSTIESAYSVKLKKKVPRTVSNYVFNMDELTRSHLFTIPEFPLTKLFATPVFADRFLASQLCGLLFEKVFPSDEA